MIYVNQVGGNDSLVFDGDSVVVLPDGRIAAQASSFVEDLVLFDTETNTGELHAEPADESRSPSKRSFAARAITCANRAFRKSSLA